ncbi:molybdate ABC transporter permease subunit [Alkalicoccus urumqiensis]|uniref:Molybdenum transport system permease n=1 Tax=Alkalicoccus urumqiensis TaxID=1548213 RepID=A0A2P6MLY3_ALKUR|nr:molybdate ABC transporter permease subunit [Alkalicoccus urumqiensis]PRO67292.1 molybdate ABC transporter permease subunit [Alkalicoccus urumqiensis]
MSFWNPVLLSFQVIVLASLIAFTGAILAAWLMRGRRFRGRLLLETFLMLPLVLPPTVIGFALLVLFGRNSWAGQLYELLFSQPIVFTYAAAVLAAAVVAFPLMYQTFRSGFETVDADLIAAGRQLGAGNWELLRWILLPLAWRSILTGFMLGTARGLGEFGATIMIAGSIPGRTETMPTAIYNAVQTGNTVTAAGWVAVLIAFSFVLLAAVLRLTPKE